MQKGTMPVSKMPVPTESVEQQCLFRWAAYNRGKMPELNLMFHIPNGGKRGKCEAGRFRAEGVKAGVPDICLPVARGGKHGLFIEMKRRRGGRVSGEQEAWMEALGKEGYAAVVCRGWEEAAKALTRYLSGKKEVGADVVYGLSAGDVSGIAGEHDDDDIQQALRAE